MPKLPSFRYMGGKSRLRSWLLSLFPNSGSRYVEPFAGRGNVFYAARALDFAEWILSDTNVEFFKSLIQVDIDALPLSVSRSDFEHYRESGCDVSRVIESRVTFAGKGYKAGYDGGDPSHPPYNGILYRETCLEARKLLSDASIIARSWDEWDWTLFGPEDFVYLDPPYYGTKASYANIDHAALVSMLNGAAFRWALSGYASDLYDTGLSYTGRYVRERNSEIKGSNARAYSPVTEVLWTNYSS